MKKLVEQFPALMFGLKDFENPEATYKFLSSLVRALREYQIEVARIVNFNGLSFISQNDPPTLTNGQIMLWKDANAASGQPTHYLIAKDDNGTTVTFRSVEQVP